MTDDASFDPTLRLVQQLFNTATQTASAAMCRWTNGQVRLSLDEVCEVPLEEATEQLDVGFDLLTMILLHLEGEVGGQFILTFDEHNGRQLAASLLQREIKSEEEWSDLEKSALNETGNILGCAYMNALTHLLDCELVPSPPQFVQDYGASVLQQALMAQAMTSDRVMICRTTFHREDRKMDWNVFFVPTLGMRQAIESTLQCSP